MQKHASARAVHRKLTLIPEALVDVNEGNRWYESQSIGLGEEFLRALDLAFHRITTDPERYPIRIDPFRRILLSRFPYAVYFETEIETIYVHYVFHCAQNPLKLKERFNHT
jgi:hypothetical protein